MKTSAVCVLVMLTLTPFLDITSRPHLISAGEEDDLGAGEKGDLGAPEVSKTSITADTKELRSNCYPDDPCRESDQEVGSGTTPNTSIYTSMFYKNLDEDNFLNQKDGSRTTPSTNVDTSSTTSNIISDNVDMPTVSEDSRADVGDEDDAITTSSSGTSTNGESDMSSMEPPTDETGAKAELSMDVRVSYLLNFLYVAPLIAFFICVDVYVARRRARMLQPVDPNSIPMQTAWQ